MLDINPIHRDRQESQPLSVAIGKPEPQPERFGIRHLMIWMLAIAVTSAIFRLLSGLEFVFLTERGWENVTVESVFRAWIDAGLSAENARRSVGIGSLLGLGWMVVRTKDPGQSFWSHPAKVLFGLMLALALLEFGQFLMYFFVGENVAFLNEEYLQLYGMGTQSTAFVWTFYVAIRSRCGWSWRLGIFLMALTCMAEVFFVGAYMLATFRSSAVTAAIPATVFVHLLSVACLSLLSALVLQLAMIYEVIAGKHRDWRTWVTIAIPATILLLNWEAFYELYRYWKLNGFQPGLLS